MKIILGSGGNYVEMFTVRDETGAAVNADSLPTVSAYLNGVLDAGFTAALTVANVTTGVYKITGVVSGVVTVGDYLDIIVTTIISGVTTKTHMEGVQFNYPNDAVLADILTNQAVLNALSSDVAALQVDVTAIQASIADMHSDTAVSTEPITVYRDSTGPDPVIRITDEDGDPIDLTAAVLKFVVFDPRTNAIVFEMTEATGLSVGGTGNNKVTVDVDSMDLATAGSFTYELWNDDGANKTVLATGVFLIASTHGV